MQTLPSSFLRFAWLTHNSESCYGLAALEQAGERAAEHELKMAVEAERRVCVHAASVRRSRALALWSIVRKRVEVMGQPDALPPSASAAATLLTAGRNLPSGLGAKQLQMETSLSEARLEKVQRCLNGQCEYAATAEPRMTCTGSCHTGLHGLKCAQLSQGSICLGFFTCASTVGWRR